MSVPHARNLLRPLFLWFFAVYILSFSFSIYAAEQHELRFERISVEAGLSDSIVTSILQDRKDLLWIGTENGLNRYDGYHFIRYKHISEEPHSLSSNKVTALYEDRQGVLWIGTEDGLQRYDRSLDRFISYPCDSETYGALNNCEITAIHEDHSETLWIGTEDGLHSYQRQNDLFLRFQLDSEEDAAEDEREEDEDHDEQEDEDLPEESILSIYHDRSGVLWIGTSRGLIGYAEGKYVSYTHDPEDPSSLGHTHVNVIYEDRRGDLWFGSDDGGLQRFNREREQFEHFRHDPKDPKSLSHDQVNAIHEDRAGVLWIGTLNGLNQFHHQSERFIRSQNDPLSPSSLSYNEIGAIFEDRSGLLWIGTDGGGLNKLNRRSGHFLHYQHQPYTSNSLSHNRVQALLEDRDGNLWIGTEVGGLNHLNRRLGEFTHYRHAPGNPDSLSSDEVTALYEDSHGTLWVGTDEGGLNRFDENSGRFKHYLPNPDDSKSLSHTTITCLYEDRQGIFWVGTDGGGLNRFDRKTEVFHHFRHGPEDVRSLSADTVWTLHEDREGVLWVGTSDGLNQFDREAGEFLRYHADPDQPGSLSHPEIWAIHEDALGTLWLGTSGGLNRFKRSKKRFTHYMEEDGLSHDSIYGIQEDETGNLWLSTGKGLSRFDPNTGAVKNYGRQELQNSTFMRGASYKSRSGEIFFGGMHGFNAFYPDEIAENPHVPELVITDFRIFNRPVPIGPDSKGCQILESSIMETQEIVLSHKDKVFSFEFAALDFTIPSENQYAYMMEGFETSWNEIGPRRVATYTNLPTGTYNFRLKASNNDGVWNEEGLALGLTIMPPFWETIWFRSLIVISIIGATYGGYAWRIRQMKAHQEQLEHEVQERTKELVGKNAQIIQQQNQLIESEKMAALGQLVAGIAHEINTPLGAIRASIGNISTAQSETLRDLPQLFHQLNAEQRHNFFGLLEKALEPQKPLSSREERRLRRLVRKELEAGGLENADDIAETLVEIGIYNNLEPFIPLFQGEENTQLLKIAYNIASQHSNSDNIRTAVDRASKIIFALKSYAHYDESGQMTTAQITEGIDVVLTLYHNQLKRGVELKKDYEENLPAIPCYPDELSQVWTNLIHNAIQAMQGAGTLEIGVSRRQEAESGEEYVLVEITDSGGGIPEEMQSRIFDPFFTTKSAGEGSGLGLTIVRKIIDKHRGGIQVESHPGKTCFSVRLPVGKC